LADLASLVDSNGAVIKASLDGTVKMHPTHLRQVLQNLLTNALKYRSPDRRPEIVVTTERTRCSRIIVVRDNGIGISSKYHEYIFGLFKRLHKADEYSGTGIGLAICARIMDRYSGRIWVESEAGMGSAFHIEIPD
jgi:light-regulated signal transduction histidine kinase (bacteriophytochrome)